MATSFWAVLSAQACPLLIPAHLCCPEESVTPCPGHHQRGKAIFSSVKKSKQAYNKHSVLINAILVFCRDCGLAG